MIDVAAWRALGLELAFDPASPPPRASANGCARLADDLEHLAVERLLHFYPRERDGRLPLDEMVLLSAVELEQPLRLPKQCLLFATSPKRRSAAQTITLALSDEVPRNFQHRWDDARWLWDIRQIDAHEETRWGTTKLPVELLDPARGAAALGELERACRKPSATTGERAALAILLVRAGRWRDALELHGVTCALDDLPYGTIDPKKWDDALELAMRNLAPWRLGLALNRLPARQIEWRLFNFPGEITSRKHGVMLTQQQDRPHLGISYTASNTRAADLDWRWPPDLDLLARGLQPSPPKGRAARVEAGSHELDLLAQIGANPADLDARRVYADMLSERGHPRGELITLQLAGSLSAKARKRMRELERGWRDWLGPLGPLVDNATFEQGFLRGCTLGSTSTPYDAWTAALEPRARAELAAVRSLELSEGFPPEIARELLVPGYLRSLSRLSIVPALLELVPPLDVLEVRVDRAPLAVTAVGSPLATAAELRVAVTDVTVFGSVLAACLPLAFTRPLPIRRFVVASSRFEVAATRDPGERMSVITATAAGPNRGLFGRVLPAALADCVLERVTRVVIRADRIAAWQVENIRRACANLNGAELVLEAAP